MQPLGPRAPVVTAAALLAGVVVALHGYVARWPFVSDDYIFLCAVRDPRNLWSAFLEAPNYFRPIGRELYFSLLYHTAGNRPFAFHVVNFAILIGTIALVMWVAGRLAGPRAAVLAGAAYSLFYPHRVLMGWISCSQDLLATALALVAVGWYLGGRRLPAAAAYLAALFSKESVIALPLVLGAWEVWAESERPGFAARLASGFRKTRALWAATALWGAVVLAVRVRFHAWAQGGSAPVADVSIEPKSFLDGFRSAVLSYFYIDQPWSDLRVAVAKMHAPWLALGLLAGVVVLAAMLRLAPEGVAHGAADPARRARAWRLGLVWAIVGAVPVALAGHHFSAYYASFAAVGFALFAGELLARRGPAVWAPALGIAAALVVAANQVKSFRPTVGQPEMTGISVVTCSRMIYETSFLDSLRAGILRDPPPRGAVIYLSRAPHYAAVPTGYYRAPKVWFDDPTLELTYIRNYRPGAEARPRRFLRYEADRRSFVPLPDSLVDAIALGEDALARGEARAAVPLLERALRHCRPGIDDIERVDLQNSLGVAAAQVGDTALARRAWRGTLALDPGHRGALLNLAGLEAEAGRWDAARVHVLAILARQPQDPVALTGLFEIDRARGDSAAAAADWRRLAAVYPGYADSLLRSRR